MWAGRFQKTLDEKADDFNSSLRFDCRMYAQDIRGSMAHAMMLEKQGIVDKADVEKILDGLDGILHDLDAGILAIDENAEDIHMFVEAELTKRIGDAGKKLHTARSRNDQVALDIRLYLRDKAAGLPIAIPKNYFPNDDDTKEPLVRWRSCANLFYSNWLNYFVYQTTPYDISKIQ